MNERQNAAGEKAQAVPNESNKQQAQSPEEAKILEILEQARQNVAGHAVIAPLTPSFAEST